MRSRTKLPVTLLIAVILGTGAMISCSREGDDRTPALLLGIARIMNSPVVMRSTTYDLDDRVIAISEQRIFNMEAGQSQPAMHEIYGGVEIQIDLTDFDITDLLNSMVTQTPLLAQLWSVERMASSADAGPDGVWMTDDDAIDPLFGYHETARLDDVYRLIEYADFGATPKGRVDYTVEKNRKVAAISYGPGPDGAYGTEDDTPGRTTLFHYNGAGKLERAENYSGDGSVFSSLHRMEYDAEGRLLGMNSYRDLEGTNRLNYGSYSELTWDESGERKSLTISLGIQINMMFYWQNISMMKFNFEFNDDGTIHKEIMYEPLSTSSIDTCKIHIYPGRGLLGMAGMSDGTDNYSDDGITQVSYTVHELILAGM